MFQRVVSFFVAACEPAVTGIFSELGLLLKIITVQTSWGEAVCRASQPSVHIFPWAKGSAVCCMLARWGEERLTQICVEYKPIVVRQLSVVSVILNH